MERQETSVVYHRHLVASSGTAGSSYQVRRSMKGKKGCVIFNAPQSQKYYVANINAVDWNNCDSVDYLTSIRTT